MVQEVKQPPVMTIEKIQQLLEIKTGVKVKRRKLSGSMRGYYALTFESSKPAPVAEIKALIPNGGNQPTYYSLDLYYKRIDLHESHLTQHSVILLF